MVLADKDDDVREAAVRALAANPAPTSLTKLIAALGSATGQAKIGLLNALGHRRDVAAVKVIASELLSDDEATAVAAARALGRIPGPDGLALLKTVQMKAKSQLREAVDNALLTHADRLVNNSQIDQASAIFRTLNTPEEPRGIRLAALRGVLRTAGDEAGEWVVKILKNDDTAAHAVAVGQIESLSPAALKQVAAAFDDLPVPSRVMVVTAVADRGDRTYLAVAQSAAKSGDPDVQRAGLVALGRLGNESTVEWLLTVLSDPGPLAGVAADSLARLSVEGVSEKLTKVLSTEQSATRIVATIGVLERRRAVLAVPAILERAAGTDSTVRTAAFAALRSLATWDHTQGMVQALLKTEPGIEREQAEMAVSAVLAQHPTPEKRSEPVLAVIQRNPSRTKDLLPLLGRIGGPNALRILRSALAETEPDLRAAAVSALCNWPDPSANADLLGLAEREKPEANRILAVKALIRINTVAGERSPDDRLSALGVLKKTMPLAIRDDERKAILAGLGNVKHVGTLRFLVPYLDQPAFTQAACKGIVEVAHSKTLREPNKSEFGQALDQVILLCNDKGLVDRAKQYKEGR